MNPTVSFDALLQSIQTLSLTQKRELQEHLEQQIFEAEEAGYVEDEATRREMAAVQAEYAAGDFVTFDGLAQVEMHIAAERVRNLDVAL
ncbi:MAG: hypothetical protein ACPGVO_11390 [Spirulinaceae cyanobacterium]